MRQKNSYAGVYVYIIILTFLSACTTQDAPPPVVPSSAASTNEIITVQTADNQINNADALPELRAEKQLLDEKTLSEDYGLSINDDYSGTWESDEESLPIVFIERGRETSDPSHSEFIIVLDAVAYSLSQIRQFEYYPVEDNKVKIKSLWTQLLNNDGEIVGEFVFKYNKRGTIIPKETIFSVIPEKYRSGKEIDIPTTIAESHLSDETDTATVKDENIEKKDEDIEKNRQGNTLVQRRPSRAVKMNICYETGKDGFPQTGECDYYTLTEEDSPILVPSEVLTFLDTRDRRKSEQEKTVVVHLVPTQAQQVPEDTSNAVNIGVALNPDGSIAEDEPIGEKETVVDTT